MASRRAERRRSCRSKRAYPTEASARKAASLMVERTVAAGDSGLIGHYRCRHCGRWHVGHYRRLRT